jgi:hypothetical protein
VSVGAGDARAGAEPQGKQHDAASALTRRPVVASYLKTPGSSYRAKTTAPPACGRPIQCDCLSTRTNAAFAQLHAELHWGHRLVGDVRFSPSGRVFITSS